MIGVAIWKQLQYYYLSKLYNEEKRENAIFMKSFKSSVLESGAVSMEYLRREIKFDYLDLLYKKNIKGYKKIKEKLIVIFSELSCSVCQNIEIKFIKNFVNKFGSKSVIAIFWSPNKSYVYNYIRVSRVSFSVYFAKDEQFFKTNRIRHFPLLLLIDENNRVIMAHYPIPGFPQYSKYFHLFCLSL